VEYRHLKAADPSVYKAMLAELARQRDGVELIPSENIVSVAVLEALGTVFTNKYADRASGTTPATSTSTASSGSRSSAPRSSSVRSTSMCSL